MQGIDSDNVYLARSKKARFQKQMSGYFSLSDTFSYK